MRLSPVDLLKDMVALIEIELAYAAAEIRVAETSGEELGRAMEHIASAVTLLRKLSVQVTEPLSGDTLCEV